MTRTMGEELNLALALEGRTTARGEARELVALADDLAKLPEPEIDQSWAAALEAHLLTEGLEVAPASIGRPRLTVVEQPVEQPTDEPEHRAPVVTLPRRRMVVRRSVAAVVAVAMLGAFPVAAAASSLPGSPFYGLKRAMERAQIAVFGGPVADGFAYMNLANTRLDEAEQLSALGRSDADIPGLLADADASLIRGSELVISNTDDPAALTKLATLAGEAKARAQGMQPALSDDIALAADAPIATAKGIEDEVASKLGGPAPTIISPAVRAPTDPTTSLSTTRSSSSSSTTRSSSSSGGSKSSSTVSKTAESEPTGTGKNLSGEEHRGCEIPGSADGFGDLFAVATKVWC